MKRVLSIILSLSLIASVMWSSVVNVSAAQGDPWVIQIARSGSASGAPFDYSSFDWNMLGENLVPDPTVSHFDVDGEYGRYANADANFNPVDINTYYWWDKPSNVAQGFTRYYKDLFVEHNLQGGLAGLSTDEHGHYVLSPGKNYGGVTKHTSGSQYQVDGVSYDPALRSSLNWNAVKKSTEYNSITDDGSGVLRFSSSGAYRHLPFPSMQAGKYYVIKYNVRCTTSNSGGLALFLDDTTFSDDTRDGFIAMGPSFAANGNTSTACFLIYTGSNTYTDPLASVYIKDNAEVFFDDFGMYEVTADYAAKCSDGKMLSDVNPSLDSEGYGFQTSLNSNNKVISYSEFEWDALGENIFPDPTVNNFIDDGEGGLAYGKYAAPDSNYNPSEINEYYLWDKYINQYHGFTMYYKDMEDGVLDGTAGGDSYTLGYQSPANWGFVKFPDDPDYKSLTDDGSGVIFVNTKGNRYLPLPTMEKYSYYVISFNARFNTNVVSTDFGIYSSSNGVCLVNLNPKGVLANGKTDKFTCLIYTGDTKYNNAVLRMYVNTGNEFYFDDFGMYKITEEMANTCAEGMQLADYYPDKDPTTRFMQTTIDTSGVAIDYSSFDWENYGENLFPDPTVNNFVDDGEGGLVYGRYSKINSYFDPVEVDESYWWDKYIDVDHGFNLYYKALVNGLGDADGENIVLGEPDENGYRTIPLGSFGTLKKDEDGKYTYDGKTISPGLRSPQNRGAVRTTGSLTNDGSGVLYDTAPSAGYKYYPIPRMKKYRYYLVKFDIKFQTTNWSPDIYIYNGSQKISDQLFQMSGLGKKRSTVTLIVYTGINAYRDLSIGLYLEKDNAVSLDNFGMYEISEEYASWCSDGEQLADPPMEFKESWAIQTSREPNGGLMISYSDFDWSVLGDNLIPDPTVAASNFTGSNYGKYATADASFNPSSINRQYWWDKYIEKYNGFTMYNQDMADGKYDKAVDGQSYEILYRSPANRSGCVLNNSSLSLTDDGSGVLYDKANYSYRAYPLPKMNINSYYVVKFNIKFNGTNNSPVELCLVPDDDSLKNSDAVSSIMLGSALGSGKTYTMTFFVYTGSNVYTDPFIRLLINNVDTYLDDFGMYKVSKSYAELCSEGKKLWDMQCDTEAYGFRNNDKAETTCNNSKNLVEDYDCTSSDYWYSEDGFATISNEYAYTGTTSLKVSGNGTLRKRFTFAKNTEYYLALWGRGDGIPVVSDINFGFMDIHGHIIPNPLSSSESERVAFSSTAKEQITIQCQDGTWYHRVYRFNTMNVDTLDFFVTGTKGTLYLDDIRIFKVSDGYKNTETISDLTTNSVSKYSCEDKYNIIPNGDLSNGSEFWGNFVGYDESVNVITSDNNSVLHFKGNNNYCYYLPYVTVESGVSYTYSYWAKNISGSNTKYGIVSLNNPKGFISEPVSISSNVGTWKRYTVSFTAHTETKIAFAIFDVDGEAVFDDFKLFKTKNGTTSASETPTDPSFAWTYLSITNGKKNEYRQQYENVDWNDYGEKVYSNSNVQTSSTLDNGKKYKRISTSSLTKYNYYMVSYSLTVDSSADVTINHYCTDQSNSFNSTTVNFSEPGSKEVSMIFCTGPNSGNPNFEIGSDADFQVSNINIYKITDKELGRLCIKEKRLIILGDLDYNLILNYVDLINLRRNVLEETYSDSLLLNDVNSDSIIDVRDVVRIKKKIIK